VRDFFCPSSTNNQTTNPTMNKRYQVLAVLALLSAITFMDRLAISSSASRIMQDLNISTTQWGWVLAVFVLSYGGFEVPTGLLGDRIGAKRVLIRVVLWWSLFTILTGFASGFVMLLIVRFLFGAGEAGAYPNTSIVLSKWFPLAERGRAQAIIWAASRVGAACTPLVVIPIQQSYGWQTAFYFLGFLGILWVIFWQLWHKEDPTDAKDISATELQHILQNRTVSSHDTKKPFSYFLKQRNLWFLMCMYFCYAAGAFFFQSWFATYLQKGRNLSEDQLKAFASYPFLLAAVGCIVGGFLSDALVKKMGLTWGRRILGITSLAISGLLILSVAFVEDNITAIILLSLGMAIMDITAPVSWAVSMDIGGANSGTISGAMNTAGLTGSYLTTIAFGYLVSAYGYQMPVKLLGCILMVGAVLWFKIDASEKL
jgi:MFS transporter, ACS family, glucarate transporter